MAELIGRQIQRVLKDGQRRFRLDIPAFELRPGDRKVIFGRTGSGKTTAMDILALACPPDTAARFELRMGGRSTDLARGKRDHAPLRAKLFGYVLQSSPLFPFLTFEENASLGQRLAGRRDSGVIADLCQRLGLDAAPRTRVSDLSIGQRQRLAVVRAIAHRPSFILCDEPTASLDPDTARILLRTVLDVADELGAALLIISHDRDLTRGHDFEYFEVVEWQPGHAMLRPQERDAA
ncbi:putative ABC transport system ATP-binding protein [Angulomicrobium tetraedrale]|uniref:Putative ABC transport system ATP-binding protein n=1 Tax=Ancylobacter tetraedralis TaxID=217068 RepID=A0A839ZE32_9HYPH|nr:ATP-binding cassette domain-containing protein [Ancylobacter tetraedralis]MBB3772927.1 putative ABC transport system ATP-binding protein [Ancylobacter tetraedralis]